MSFTREEALAKVGTRVELHDDVDESGEGRMYFSGKVPAGTTGTVIHANLRAHAIELLGALIIWRHKGGFPPTVVLD